MFRDPERYFEGLRRTAAELSAGHIAPGADSRAGLIITSTKTSDSPATVRSPYRVRARVRAPGDDEREREASAHYLTHHGGSVAGKQHCIFRDNLTRSCTTHACKPFSRIAFAFVILAQIRRSQPNGLQA